MSKWNFLIKSDTEHRTLYVNVSFNLMWMGQLTQGRVLGAVHTSDLDRSRVNLRDTLQWNQTQAQI